MFLECILSVILIIIVYLYWLQTCSNYARSLNAFPGPRIVPVFGNILGYSLKPDVLFSQVRKILQQYDQTFRGWSSIFGSVNIVTADDAEIVLKHSQDVTKGFLYAIFKPWLHNGLLISEGSLWHHRRKMISPAFHFNILRKFVDIFSEHSNSLIETLKLECGNPKTDVVPLMSQFALASICETSMGIKIDPQDNDQNEYFNCLHKIAPFFIQRVFTPWLVPSFIYYRTSIYERYKILTEKLHKFSSKVINEREKNFQESDADIFNSKPNEADDVGERKLALLDLLISKKKRGDIDDQGIKEEVDTFVFAGHDTTAVSACFTLMLLANHKEIQAKAIEEVDEIFGPTDRPATYDDLINLKYLDRCIKESLRLYPSVPAISRYLKEDVKFTHHVVPAGTTVFIHIYNIHRDPKVYPDPEKFDPDRFLPENCKQRSHFAYIPFSAGSRNCIGQKFAFLEIKIIISSILRHFTLEPIDSAADITLMVDLVLRMKDPLYIKFNSRSEKYN